MPWNINAEQVHILVVEDSLTQAEQLRYALEQKGFCVTIQRDGEQALAWMQEHLPTLIISDIVMPRMNGYQLCKAVKDDPRLREIPFMLLTSLSDPADVIEGLKAGADDFVVKPFNEEFLLSRIKYLLANRVLRQNTGTNLGMEIYFAGEHHFLTSDRMQIVDLLLSTFESAVLKNKELEEKNRALLEAHQRLEEAHRQLQQSEHRYRLLAEHATDMISRHDPEGRFLYVSPACRTLLGYEPEELLGRSAWELLHPDDVATVVPLAELVRRGETVSNITFRMRRKDGGYVWFETTRKAVVGADGELAEMVAVTRDVSARKAQEEELVRARQEALEASRLKSAFLANMSHEIRTPMNGGIGMTDLLQQTELTEEQKNYVQAIHASGEALLALINDILDFSKIEARKLELEHIPFDVREVVHETINLLTLRAEEKGLTLVYRVAPAVPRRLVGDPYRFRQILTNLVNNAVKFTHEGLVEVGLDAEVMEEGRVRLKAFVRDTGIGIPPERMDRLFEAFSQVEASDTRKYGGTGLGLAICRQLVEMMGGAIEVKSMPGEGSTFRFTVVAEQAEAEVPEPGLPGRRVLVVEPDAARRQVLVEILTEEGAEVTAAQTLPEAEDVEASGPERVEAVVLAVEALRGAPQGLEAFQGPGLPVVLITPLHAPSAIVDGRAVGAQDHLPRPVHPGRLRQTLQRLLGMAGETTGDRIPAEQETSARVEGRILIVEDNDINRTLAISLLRKLGFTDVQVAVNGREAVEAARQTRFALILMDCQMPVLNGFDAAAAIRAFEAEAGRRRTPIVALTAHVPDSIRSRCTAAGMDDVLAKPFRAKAFEEMVRRWFDPDPALPAEGDAPAPSQKAACTSEVPARDDQDANGPAAPDMPPEILEQLMHQVVGRIPERLEALRSASGAGDLEAVAEAAHKLKGSCFGEVLAPLAALAQTLEKAARAGVHADVERLLDEAERTYERLRPELGSAGRRLARTGVD
ncbi:MAG: hypothetical protein KatS3mg042_0506 [Rhodothermaceae bacterium]|nr:MAG: hypothetical protein KatS3mg042_0506 [Rhodothermaceae bacterium]